MNDQTIEQEIQAKGLTAPRVTPADIEASIASEHYFTASQGCIGNVQENPSDETLCMLDLVTFCVLVLKNGTKIVGVNEGPVSAENFNAQMGRTLARAKATDQIWPLLGYELRTNLAS